MGNYRTVELYDDQGLITGLEDILDQSEMSSYERSFLCGLLKEKKPKKILEVGVAAGATTAILLQFLKKERMEETQLFSVDYSEKYYLDERWNSGFLASRYFSQNKNWHLLLGHTVAAFLDEICADGEKIDFLILDTMHILPGEIIDFLACLPYLADGAVVAMHDVSLNLRNENCYHASATRVLFSAVTGEKIYGRDVERYPLLPNIGAFIISNDTRKNVADLFSALHLTWDYLPSDSDWKEYKKVFQSFYENELNEVLNCLIEQQKCPFLEKKLDQHYSGNRQNLLSILASSSHNYIYGAGMWGTYYYQYLKNHHIHISNIIVSDGETISPMQQEIFDGKVVHLSEIHESGEKNCVLAISKMNIHIIRQQLEQLQGWNII